MAERFHIYMLTCTANGRRYVGVTELTPQARFQDHVWNARHPKRRKKPIQQAIADYGEGAFTIDVLAVAETIEEAAELERQMIAKHRTLISEGGYNVSPGGRKPRPMREVRRRNHYTGKARPQ